jgi:hypothetical protein
MAVRSGTTRREIVEPREQHRERGGRGQKEEANRVSVSVQSAKNGIPVSVRSSVTPEFRFRYSAARQDTSSDRDCRFDQKEESSMIGRDLFNTPCRICRRPTLHRTRTRHPERKSKSEGHCGSYRAGRERRNSQIPTCTQKHLPTSTHSNGFYIIRVYISSSSSFGFCQISEIPVSGGPYGPGKYIFDYTALNRCLKGSVFQSRVHFQLFLGTGAVFS